MTQLKSTLFDPELVNDLITKVGGHSSLAKLSAAVPVAFNGNKEFTFAMESDIDVVAEAGAKSHGGIVVEPVTIVPIKIEYGARVSDEFLTATDEENIPILEAFNDGFAKKVAVGIDKMGFHGINPRTGNASTVIGANHFDAKVTKTVTYDPANPDKNLDDAISLVENDERSVNGTVISTAMRSALAAMKDTNGNAQYPDFRFGGCPEKLGVTQLDVNSTIAVGSVDEAIVGDFKNMFKWGIAKEIPLKVIEYGDPDNTGRDLAGHNEVYLRAEAYIGWAILDPASFARIKD